MSSQEPITIHILETKAEALLWIIGFSDARAYFSIGLIIIRKTIPGKTTAVGEAFLQNPIRPLRGGRKWTS